MIAEMLAGACHVSWSDMRVVRYVYSRMDRRTRKNRSKAVRKIRHGVYRAVLRAHHRNQKLFFVKWGSDGDRNATGGSR